MRARQALFIALAAAVALTSVAAAGPAPTKQRVQIDMKIYPKKTFALATLQTGALKRDSGTHACNGETERGEVQRNGQQMFSNHASPFLESRRVRAFCEPAARPIPDPPWRHRVSPKRR